MSFPRYPKYKDSGVEWLGEVPEHWEVPPLYLRYEAVLGKMLDEKRLTRKHSTPYLRNVDVQWNRVNTNDLPEMDIAPAEYDRFTLRYGDILICEGGEVGRTAIWRGELQECAFQKAIHRLRPLSRQEDARYFFYCMNFAAATGVFLAEGNPNTIPHLTGEKLRRYRFPMPQVDEQAAIAAFLDRETAKIDALVEEQRRLIELLKEKRQAVISHAVTKGLNPDVPMKPSGIDWLGDVPMSWTVNKLGRAAFMQEGPGLRTWQFTDTGTRVICVTNITDAGIDFSRLEKFISREEHEATYRHFTVQRGDILLSSSGNSWGKVSIYDDDEDVILNTSTIRLNESDGRELRRDYIAMLLQSDTIREQLGLAMTGSCQPNFGPSHLSSVMVAIPSRAEQELSSSISKLKLPNLIR